MALRDKPGVQISGFEELSAMLLDFSDKVANRMIKDTLFSVAAHDAIPLIQQEIASDGLVRTGKLINSITITKRDFRGAFPALTVGPGRLGKAATRRLIIASKGDLNGGFPWYASALEKGTKERISKKNGKLKGRVKPYHFMLNSYNTIKLEYREWMKAALAKKIQEYKVREMKKAQKKHL